MKTIHELKIWPEFFAAVVEGRKSFEIRKNDRNFKVGDILVLKEFEPAFAEYSGKEIKALVTYMTAWEQLKGNVVMSISTQNGEL